MTTQHAPVAAEASSPRAATCLTRYPWHLQRGVDTPEPLASERWAVCPIGERPGFETLDAVRATGAAVRPVLHCPDHRLLHVPVPPRPEGCPVAERVALQTDLHCRINGDRVGYHACASRHWLLPDRESGRRLTDFDVLVDELHRLRARWRQAA